jgi:signal transduction histidine kinase
MMDVAYSDARAARFDFNREVVLANWSVLYVHRDSPIRSIMDTDRKRIAVVKDSIQQGAFSDRAKAFDVVPVFVETHGFEKIFELIEHGAADGGIVNRLYGAQTAANYNVRRTNVLVKPTNLHFIAPKGRSSDLLAALDRDLKALKAREGSIYYALLHRWLAPLEPRRIPPWTPWVAGVGILAFAAVLVFLAMLRRQIALKSAAEGALRKAKESAEMGTQAKSEFLAQMSHELRTPLNAIIGFSEMIRHETLGPVGNPKYLEYVGNIHDSGTHLLELVNDVLDISAIEAGRLELHLEQTDLADAVRASITLLGPKATEKRQDIAYGNRDDALPLLADPRRLRQIVINLLANAVKYTPAGGRIGIETGHNADGWLTLAVSDTGVGMTKAEIALALEPFRQAGGAYTQHEEGTGLGLPLTRALVELHGGRLDIDSEPRIGTTVTVRLPAGGPSR